MHTNVCIRGSSLECAKKCLESLIGAVLDRIANYTNKQHISHFDYYLQVELHMLVDGHNSGLVTASITVVWCRENCDNVAVVGPVVSIHH